MCSLPPTRIAFCITELDAGGAERILTQLVLGLDRSEWEPQVWSLGPAGPYAGVLTDAGIPVHCLDAIHAWDAPRIVWRLRRDWRAFQPSMLQTFLFSREHSGTVRRVAGRGAAHCVGDSRGRSSQPVFPAGWIAGPTGWWNGTSVSAGAWPITASANAASIPPRTVVIPNGVDPRLFSHANPMDWRQLGLPEDAFVMLTIGRLEEQKGIDDLLTAFATIAPKFPKAQLVGVGDGPDRKKLEACSVSLGVANRVWLLGRRTDVPQLLAGADLFVLASRWEGMPNVRSGSDGGRSAGDCYAGRGNSGTSHRRPDRMAGSGERSCGFVREVHHRADVSRRGARMLDIAAQRSVVSQFTTEVMVAKYVALYRLLTAGAS